MAKPLVFFCLCGLAGEVGGLRAGKGGSSSERSLESVPWKVALVSREATAGSTSFTYRVTCEEEEAKDLSHWGLLVSQNEMLTVDLDASTPGWLSSPGPDGSAGDNWMIKYDKLINCPTNETGVEIVLVLTGEYDMCAGEFLVKGGTDYAIGSARIPCDDRTTSIEGDPHLQNIQGEFFDVWKLGSIDLLRFPQDRKQPAFLLVQGTISKIRFADGHMDATCDGPVITAVDFSGSWLGTTYQHMNVSLDVENLALKFNAEDFAYVNVNASEQHTLKFTIHGVDLTVEAKARFNRQYLRFVAEHVNSFHGAVGGLLGLDDHSDQSLRPDVCGENLAFYRIGALGTLKPLMAFAS